MGTRPLALLIDGENVAPGHMPAIGDRSRRLGDPVVGCVVGDFSENRLSEWARLAPPHALELVFQRSCGKGRNSADIALTIRAMDMLGTEAFGGFLIVSSDCDFAPLALRLRRTGLAVYGMGEAKADAVWRAACTEFFELGSTKAARPGGNANSPPVSAKPPPSPPKSAFTKEDREAIRTILRSAAAAGSPWLTVSELGQRIRRSSVALGSRVCGKGRLAKGLGSDPLVELRGRGGFVEARLRTLDGLARPSGASIMRPEPPGVAVPIN